MSKILDLSPTDLRLARHHEAATIRDEAFQRCWQQMEVRIELMFRRSLNFAKLLPRWTKREFLRVKQKLRNSAKGTRWLFGKETFQFCSLLLLIKRRTAWNFVLNQRSSKSQITSQKSIRSCFWSNFHAGRLYDLNDLCGRWGYLVRQKNWSKR